MWLFPPFRLDVANQRLWRGEATVPLMPKPFAVLKYLVEHAGRLVTQDELLDAVWADTHVQPEVLRRYILEIRRVLGDQAAKPRFIETLPKRGYRFIAAVTSQGAASVLNNAGPQKRLVGRDSAMTELDGYLQSVMRGERQICVIAGEAGIGKTSLVDAFQLSLNGKADVQTMRGQCVEGFTGKEPYYPILEALGRVVREPAGTRIVRDLAAIAPTWMLQFPGLLRAENQAALQREVLGATRERMVREICEAIEVITQELALVLMLEDLHWVDHSTLDVLSMIARRRDPAKLLVIGTLRPVDLILSESPLKALKQDLLSHGLAHELTLHGLSEADVAAYLANEFVGLPQPLSPMIHRRSEGNPLFMTAMLDHLAQTGVLSRANGTWKLMKPLDQIDPGVPETLKQMLDLQLGHLTQEERYLLNCASVAGQHFTVCSLAIMLGSTEAEIELKCGALAERQQFLKSCGECELPSGVLTIDYEFRHSLYRDALYRELSVTQRVNLHRSLAEGLISYESPLAPALAAKIADHFEQGRRYEPAIRHLMISAQTASRRYAHRESMSILEHARDLLQKIGLANRSQLEREVLERIADVHYTLGEMAQSIAIYDSLARRAGEAGEGLAEADALIRMSHPASFVDPDRSIAACERAAQIATQIGNVTLAAHAGLFAACWRILVNGWSDQDPQIRDDATVTLSQSGAGMPAYGRLLHARALLYQSEYAKTIESADQAIEELTAGDSLWAAPAALHAKASALGYLGRLGETHHALSRGFELAQKDKNPEWLGVLQYTLFWLRWHTFDFAGMQEYSKELTESAMAGLSLQMRIQLIITQGFAHLAAGEYETARRYFEAVLEQPEHPRSILHWRAELLARHGLGETWLAQGKLAKARSYAEALVSSVTNSRDLYLTAIALEFSARLALATGERERARHQVERALEAVAAIDVRLAAWRVHATAWDVYRKTDAEKAEVERSKAAGVILQVAKSLEDVPKLHQSFLEAKRVRRVLDAGTAGTAPSRPSKPRRRSPYGPKTESA